MRAESACRHTFRYPPIFATASGLKASACSPIYDSTSRPAPTKTPYWKTGCAPRSARKAHRHAEEEAAADPPEGGGQHMQCMDCPADRVHQMPDGLEAERETEPAVRIRMVPPISALVTPHNPCTMLFYAGRAPAVHGRAARRAINAREFLPRAPRPARPPARTRRTARYTCISVRPRSSSFPGMRARTGRPARAAASRSRPGFDSPSPR